VDFGQGLPPKSVKVGDKLAVPKGNRRRPDRKSHARHEYKFKGWEQRKTAVVTVLESSGTMEKHPGNPPVPWVKWPSQWQNNRHHMV